MVTRAEKLTIWIQIEITWPVAAIKYLRFALLDTQCSHNKAVDIPQMQFLCCKSDLRPWKWLLHIRHFWQNDTWHIEKSSLANEWQ